MKKGISEIKFSPSIAAEMNIERVFKQFSDLSDAESEHKTDKFEAKNIRDPISPVPENAETVKNQLGNISENRDLQHYSDNQDNPGARNNVVVSGLYHYFDNEVD